MIREMIRQKRKSHFSLATGYGFELLLFFVRVIKGPSARG